MLVPIREGFRITALYHLIFDRIFPSDMSFGGEAHDFYELVYVESGEIEVTEDEEVYRLGEGDLILHAPMEFHRIRSSGGTEPHVFNLSFVAEGDLPEELTGGVFALDGARRAEFLEVFRFALDTWQENAAAPAISTEMQARLTLFLLHLGERRAQDDKTAPVRAYHTLVRLMSETVAENLSLEEIAARSFLSVSYVKALFHRYAGIGPRAYYNALRLRTSCRLLAEGRSVAEVSEQMHFSSPNNFIRFFKAKTGATPLQYKRGE